jgi:hypothetical protein
MENSEVEAPKARKSRAASKPSPLPSAKPAEPENLELTAPSIPTIASLNEVQMSARERGKRDLFFFCHDILGYKDMLLRVHQSVCDLWAPYDHTKPYELQDDIHSVLLLDPRGEFKTSISLGRCLQEWINWPEVATLRMSGVIELVKRSIKEVKDHLIGNSVLRELYPEAVPWSDKKNEVGMAPSDFGTAFGITHPNRKNPRREPTLTISSLDSVKSGSHFEKIVGDDLVHEKNYQTRDLLQQTIEDWDGTRNLLNPLGYRELDGTRYDWSDLYGRIIETNKGQWRIHVRPIWTDDLDFAKTHGFHIPETYVPGDLLHLHPERWTMRELLEIQSDNPYLFNCQRLNNPVPASSDNFPMVELVKHTVKREKYPDTGLLNVFMGWKFDFIDPEAEPAVGVVGGWDAKGRLFVIDLVMGRFKPSQIIDLMVVFWQKWPVSRMVLADNKRERMLEAGLMSRLRQLKLSFPIDWVKFGGAEQSEDALISHVLSLEPLLRENQLWFHADLPHLANLYLQFSRFPKFKMRAIPYAVSRLMHYRTMTQNNASYAAYGVDIVSPSLSWNREDMELGAGLTG